MSMALHKNARTTPAVRAEIAASSQTASVLAQRYGITEQTVYKSFKSYEPGYVHMDVKYLPQMRDESRRRYLFVAIDRATRWVFVQLKANKTAASAQAFLKTLHKACPIRINKLLTDNGKEFTDRLFANGERQVSGNHEFDQLCQALDIEHRLTKPRTPRTNGMVERFNGRITDVLKTHRFDSREDMEQTLLRYVALYNHQLPQSALGSKTPMQAMKEWHQQHPHLFHNRPYDRPGCDT
ncbi:DDE-type integrase/transposase/recombinase [Verminephrobacter eiseniae]|uniref:Integrase, catalytic region n=1 Tax=Verminephrobacter eiseniae (strain EF01-2) TaxID=391735 RepID=A1WKN6_VEREI|nr:DDE-type integrase/transposase/recombinase [Verminephrobacter eiseniae]ABM58193.1 Integrase, catalytic region [Verminephrobacter eiseniae EF01-2]MCW5283790.1 DDE domain-containing protein [Verminephrobacter eiseniae]MCW5301499.1 DDE domain-containing protein [Verminephrobacter eiseniae]MCW8181519.1 DDE domain-containing protein [Verminephrobacter eiseniae]MCW8191335.1 DDE domain-containing protein [Verminephrobacter eiseniae]